MEQTMYYISEAAKKVEVESHVLRYWEEELNLPIHRNEMGHRCYGEEDIERLKRIKKMKEQGFQLKAIRMVLENDKEMLPPPQKYMISLSEEKGEPVQAALPTGEKETLHTTLPSVENGTDDKAIKAARLQQLLQHMITEAVKNANQDMCTDMKESILKELDYQFRMQEERDEEHYRKIDEMIRQKHTTKEKDRKSKRKSPIV